ncbi:MAG: DUF5668 domain-containing protein [bacterium]
MKLSTLFWGVLFVAIGVLFLLDNLDILYFDWAVILKLWPLLLVLWGAMLIIGKEKPKWYVVVLVIFFALFALAGTVLYEITNFREDFASHDATTQTFTSQFGSDIDHGKFSLRSGAGKFILEDTTDQMINAVTETSFGEYRFDEERDGRSVNLDLSLEGRERGWVFRKWSNRVNVKLNPSPVWAFDLEVGASSINFDLRPFEVEDIKIDCGASSLNLQLGDRAKQTNVQIHGGASSLDITVPRSVGCEVRANTALTSKRLQDFEKIHGNLFQTENFEDAKKKIYIEIETGVSKIRIRREG